MSYQAWDHSIFLKDPKCIVNVIRTRGVSSTHAHPSRMILSENLNDTLFWKLFFKELLLFILFSLKEVIFLQIHSTACLSTVRQKSFNTESFSERKVLLSHLLTRKRTRSWDIHSKPSVAGLDGKDEHICFLGADRAFLYNEFGGERWKLF